MIPKLDGDEVSKNLSNLSRKPFRDQLARLLLGAPSEGAIKALAERSPDRYWTAVAIASRLAGYSDKLEIDASIEHNVAGMSDLELLATIKAMKCSTDKQSDAQAR